MVFIEKSAFFLLMVWSAANANAMGLLLGLGHFKFVSEIVVPWGGAAKNSSTSASESRSRARSAVNDAPTPAVTTIVIESEVEEEGVLAPSRMSTPSDNRAKARDYSRGAESGNAATVRILIDKTESPGEGVDTNQRQIENNRNKARQYSEGSVGSGAKPGTYVKIGTSVGVVGADGVVSLVCDATNNTAGRIGDDSQAGNTFSIVINGKMAKARCK